MLVLIETAAGYALFRVTDKSLLEIENIDEYKALFDDETSLKKKIKLESFTRFKDMKQAMDEVLKLTESSLGKGLKKFLKKTVVDNNKEKAEFVSTQLAVTDKQLGSVIKKKLNIDVVYTPQTLEIIRGIKQQLYSLMEGFSEEDAQKMSMSLSHSLNRFKIKFSPEKLDTMIIQAICLQDDMDKEINNLSMRLKEWYGWHFPELSKIVSDNLIYARLVNRIEERENASSLDFSDLIPEELSLEIKQAAEVSMGTEITSTDIVHIKTLAQRIEELLDYRANLSDYLKFRMKAVAPNLTHMVGEVIGARLLAHSGSLLSLSKHPASTLQILGAEKALFRALKSNSPTPKYGILFHAAIVGQAPPKSKGKISRVLASKLSLCVRVDALGDAIQSAVQTSENTNIQDITTTISEPTIAISCRNYVEKKLHQFEQENNGGLKQQKKQFQRYEPQRLKEINTNFDVSNDIQLKKKVHKLENSCDGDINNNHIKKKKIKI